MLITYLLFVAPETHLRQMSSNVGGDDELNEWFDLFKLTQWFRIQEAWRTRGRGWLSKEYQAPPRSAEKKKLEILAPRKGR